MKQHFCRAIASTVFLFLSFIELSQASPTWTLKSRGMIAAGFDFYGIFGNAGKSLEGLEFTQAITSSVDVSLWSGSSSTSFSNEIYGSGPGFIDLVTINGVTVVFEAVATNRGYQAIWNALTSPGLYWAPPFDQAISLQHGITALGERLDVVISATSYKEPFVQSLDFNQVLAAPFDFSSSMSYSTFESKFAYFSGYNVSVSVNNDFIAPQTEEIPEPATLHLILVGIFGLMVYAHSFEAAKNT